MRGLVVPPSRSVAKLSREPLYRAVSLFEERYYEASLRETGEHVELTDAELLERRIEVWRRYVLLQDSLIRRVRGKRVFVFLQPNQYLEGSKPISAEEQATAIEEDRFLFGTLRMTRLREEFAALGEAGVPAFDLTQVFADTRETVYRDACCHINERGNEILMDAVIDVIERVG